MYDDAYTRNDDGELAVRTVSVTEGSNSSSYDDVFTRDTNGKLALRVTGGGSGDSHNKGYFATQSALEEAYPTAEAGDYAIVGSTDTVWLWDEDTSAWKDSDTKGQVTSVNGQTGDVVLNLLPTQTGNSGKFLTTDGTNASWGNALANTANTWNSIATGGGNVSSSKSNSIAMGADADVSTNESIAIGGGARVTASNAIMLKAGNHGAWAVNSEAHTFKVNLGQGSVKLVDSDNKIPSDTLTHAINKYSTMPTASSTNAGWIVQYTGTTDSTYTHGYIYECKAQGTDPETYAWEAVEVQASSGGASYTAGTGIDITNDTISVSPTSYSPSGYKVRQLVLYGDSEVDVYSNSTAYSVSQGFQAGYGYVNISSNTNAPSGGVVIGDKATSNGSTGQILIGERASSTAAFSIAIGSKASVTAQGAIQLGDAGATKTNSDANTFKVGNANGNYELMSADGTVPTARLTKVNTTATLAVADWSSNTQTVTVSGVKADSVVFVSPAPASASDYASAGILCTAQAADSLTFTCTTTPTNAITVNVVCM